MFFVIQVFLIFILISLIITIAILYNKTKSFDKTADLIFAFFSKKEVEKPDFEAVELVKKEVAGSNLPVSSADELTEREQAGKEILESAGLDLKTIAELTEKEKLLRKHIWDKITNEPYFFKEGGRTKIIIPMEALVFLHKDMSPLVTESGEITVSFDNKEKDKREVFNINNHQDTKYNVPETIFEQFLTPENEDTSIKTEFLNDQEKPSEKSNENKNIVEPIANKNKDEMVEQEINKKQEEIQQVSQPMIEPITEENIEKVEPKKAFVEMKPQKNQKPVLEKVQSEDSILSDINDEIESLINDNNLELSQEEQNAMFMEMLEGQDDADNAPKGWDDENVDESLLTEDPSNIRIITIMERIRDSQYGQTDTPFSIKKGESFSHFFTQSQYLKNELFKNLIKTRPMIADKNKASIFFSQYQMAASIGRMLYPEQQKTYQIMQEILNGGSKDNTSAMENRDLLIKNMYEILENNLINKESFKSKKLKAEVVYVSKITDISVAYYAHGWFIDPSSLRSAFLGNNGIDYDTWLSYLCNDNYVIVPKPSEGVKLEPLFREVSESIFV